MIVRQMRESELDEVCAVHLAAFGQELEADLARSLHTGGYVPPELSLVAEVDGAIVGHVVCSRGQLGDQTVMGLGPIGVLPDEQRSGVGSALMHAVLGAADAMGEPMIVLLGSPDYYSRFGFTASTDVGVTPPVAEWAGFFQARTLSHHDPALTGQYTYAQPFNELD